MIPLSLMLAIRIVARQTPNRPKRAGWRPNGPQERTKIGGGAHNPGSGGTYAR